MLLVVLVVLVVWGRVALVVLVVLEEPAVRVSRWLMLPG